MTDKKLQTLARKWIKKLELGSPLWRKIDVAVMTAEEQAQHDGTLGICLWDIDNSYAYVGLAPEEKHVEDQTLMEETLVHELLHLRLQGHKEYKKEYDDPHLERALNLLAEILVKK